MKYRTTFVTKAEVIKPNSDEFKAVASSLKDKYGFDLKPQMDLLYVRACLVSAGSNAGVNDNDDIFTREEAWAARHTPVLKPFNWQHNDKDILGVMYTVQARDLSGNVLDINDETPPDCDFDLWVEAAVFKLIHEDRASEIETRARSNNLFVSMEAWFDDYSYGLCNTKGQLNKVVSRDKSTAFLDKHLRAGGGAGVYRDPESNQDMRIGRVLRSITFGGCGFVDRPANKRSVIEIAEKMSPFAGRGNTESQIEVLLQKVLDKANFVSEDFMNQTQANQGEQIKPEAIASAVESALDKREKVAAAERERAALVARAADAETLQSKVEELSQAQQEKETQLEALRTQLAEYNAAVENLVKDYAAAGATSDTPPEIAAIDAATDGESAFQAKIAWITKSMASLKERAARAEELEAQLEQAELVVREQEVRTLLDGAVSDEALEAFVSHAATLNDEEYAQWRDEKELMIIEFTSAAMYGKDKMMMDKEKEKMMKMKKMEEKKGSASLFETLLAKRRSESGMANPDTMDGNPSKPDLINHPGGPNLQSGVQPTAIRTPRHKIAGSAGNDPAQALENVQAEGGVSLAGSQASDDGDGVNPFRVLASLVVDSKEETETQTKKSGFDPVQ